MDSLELNKSDNTLGEEQQNTEVSHKHHYVPRFYLEGFTNKDEVYYVFDKKTNRIFQNIPKNTFYQGGRNNGEFQGTLYSEIEHIYTYFDTQHAPIIKSLRKLSISDPLVLNDSDLYLFKQFILFLTIRAPKFDKGIDALIDKIPMQDILNIVEEESKSPLFPVEVEEKIKNIDYFHKMKRAFLPYTILKQSFIKDRQNWKLYTTSNDTYILSSDDPIITTNTKSSEESLTKEFIFPLCSHKVIVNTENVKPDHLTGDFPTYFNIRLLHQSHRFICCESKEYLENIVNDWTELGKDSRFEEYINNKLFSFFPLKNSY